MNYNIEYFIEIAFCIFFINSIKNKYYYNQNIYFIYSKLELLFCSNIYRKYYNCLINDKIRYLNFHYKTYEIMNLYLDLFQCI